MNRLATRLRIGEKIGLGFGAIGLLFLGVAAYCQINLTRVIDGYQALNAIYGERQAAAFDIESGLLGAASAAERFLLTRDLDYSERSLAQAGALAERIRALGDIDADSRATAQELLGLTDDFRGRFEAIVEAWERRGLDEDSGLQGDFRDAAHALEERAGEYNVDHAYLLLLQVRRREKDLGLRRDPAYLQQIHELLDALSASVSTSGLTARLRGALDAELTQYRSELDRYADSVLAGEPIEGGKGPFRDAAHRIEDLLRAHRVPGLDVQVLQLRRREKDYLLRGDERYVAMVDVLLQDTRERIAGSALPEAEVSLLEQLLTTYGRDFHALVAENSRITEMTDHMHQAAARMTPLVEDHLADARQQMDRMSREIAETAAARSRAGLWVAGLAAAVGALFAVLITGRIVRPVSRMAGLLDRLTRESLKERMPTDPKGRDEINAMAIALNTYADHKTTYSDWWRNAMQQAIALRERHSAASEAERSEAEQQLAEATAALQAQHNDIHRELRQQAERVQQLAERYAAGQGNDDERAELRDRAADIETLARSLQRP